MSGTTGALPVAPGPFLNAVTNVLQGGKNPSFPWFGFNDASLKRRDIIPVLFNRGSTRTQLNPVGPAGSCDSTNTVVGRASVQVVYRFGSLPLARGIHDGVLQVVIHVFDSVRNAYTAMQHSLAALTPDDLALCGRLHHNGVPVYCGHYAIRTPNSIFCMRGNLFMKMSMLGTTRPSEEVFQMVTLMMERLDLYVGRNMVQYSQVRRPSLATAGTVSIAQYPHARFDIILKDVDSLSPDTRVLSSNDRMISSTGAALLTPMSTLMHSFRVRALPPGSSQEIVKITLCAAQQDTFHPGWTDYTVIVVLPN